MKFKHASLQVANTFLCRDSVMYALARIDPYGCRQRRQKRLVRRQYISKVHTLFFSVINLECSKLIYIGTKLCLALRRDG